MPSPLFWILAAGSLLLAILWLVLAARVVLDAKVAGTLAPCLDSIPGEIPRIDAVIPAHNEQDRLPATLASLQNQTYPRLDITVVDDQSADDTAAVLASAARTPALRHPIRPVAGRNRPEGWVGKTWAVHQGVEATTADWLWFVDADMILHPAALATAYLEARRTSADLVTLAPRADCHSFWQSVMAITLTHLLAQLYPSSRVNDPANPTALAVGGFILVRREAYERAGGHEAVRGEIIDDINLAARIKAAGGRLCLRAAPTLASTHMYGTFADIWRGLRKNVYAGMQYQPHKLVVGTWVALLLSWIPLASLLAGALGLLVLGWPTVPCVILLLAGMLGQLAQAAAAAPSCVFHRLPIPYLLTLPLGMTVYVAIAASSAWHYHRGRVLWKDRAFAAPRV